MADNASGANGKPTEDELDAALVAERDAPDTGERIALDDLIREHGFEPEDFDAPKSPGAINPYLGRKCPVCGAKPGEACDIVNKGAWHQGREGFWRTLLASGDLSNEAPAGY